jgi:hypothetical protein
MSTYVKNIDFTWCFDHAPAIDTFFQDFVATRPTKVRKGTFQPQDFVHLPEFKALHPSLDHLSKGGSLVLNKWAKKYSCCPGVVWLDKLADDGALWRLGIPAEIASHEVCGGRGDRDHDCKVFRYSSLPSRISQASI